MSCRFRMPPADTALSCIPNGGDKEALVMFGAEKLTKDRNAIPMTR